MKYDSWDDFFYFIMGASIASGRRFWVGENAATNKWNEYSEESIETSKSKNGAIGKIKVRRR